MQMIHHAGMTSKTNNMPLLTDVTGTTVTVHAGTAKKGGVEYILADDATYDPPAAPTHWTTAFGYLVKHKITNAVSVMVDEVVSDGVDTEFDFSIGDYEQLFPIFHLTVPAGGPLTAVDCHAFTYAEGER